MQSDNLDLSQVEGCVAIIPAAGSGKRFAAALAKQYQSIAGKPLLDYTLETFIHSKDCEKILLIISADDENFKGLKNITHDKIIVIEGGNERQDSVHNGLKYLFDNNLPESIPLLIHDAVRPCLTEKDLTRLLEQFRTKQEACFLASEVVDSIKQIDQDLSVSANVNREQLVAAQTPQMARFSDIETAYKQAIKKAVVATDEVSLLVDASIKVNAVIAKDPNFKVTKQIDLELAELVLKSQGRCE